MTDFPTLADYRAAASEIPDLGGFLQGTVDVDPLITDPDATRIVISSNLYDSEKLAGAFGGYYFWIPRYANQGRVLERGYRTRYVTIFEPPASGTYRLLFYGYNQTNLISATAPASSIQAQIRSVSTDLSTVDVVKSSQSGRVAIFMPSRIGMGSTDGTIVVQGGLGACLMNRDFSQPLAAGTPWYASALLPFIDEDETVGIHTCINYALRDIRIPHMLPVYTTLPTASRGRVISVASLNPALLPEDIIGYYAPVEWMTEIVFHPPASGTYQVTLDSWQPFGPNPTPLSYNATGAELETAILSIPGVQYVSVTPQSAASSYLIRWQTMYHDNSLSTTGGWVESVTNTRLRDPYPVSIAPSYREDAEQSTLIDPGYPEGHSWFVHWRMPARNRIKPQTYPVNANGLPDRRQSPIVGSSWMYSLDGLVNDLDCALPTVAQVVELVNYYIKLAIAGSSPEGEADKWFARANQQAGAAASRLAYGPIKRRGNSIPRTPFPGVSTTNNNKGLGFWLPD